MVTPDDVRQVAAEVGSHPELEPRARRERIAAVLEGISASEDEVVAAALAGLDSDDRNVRVAMLRVLAVFGTTAATAGVLRGLRDPVRRVREVALKSAAPNHVASKEVVAEVCRIAEDDAETNRLRNLAFFVLSSADTRAALPGMTKGALVDLMESERFRVPMLMRLCTSFELDDASRAVLQEFVRSGTKDEAVMATRALSGYFLARVDWLPLEIRQQAREQYDRASVPRASWSSIEAYWVPVDRVREFLAQAGLPAPG